MAVTREMDLGYTALTRCGDNLENFFFYISQIRFELITTY